MHDRLQFALTLAIGASAMTACGGGDTHQSLAHESVALAGQLVEIIEGITDEESANAAKEKFRALGQQAASWRNRMQALGTPDDALRKKIEQDLEPELAPLSQRLMKAMTAMPPELQRITGDQMSEIMTKLQVPGG